jgi:dipeptide transport system ATP-binding protein
MSLLEVRDLKKHYPIGKDKTVKALDGVSFQLEEGKTLGLVGESGCGKSTLAKTLMGLDCATSGEILFNGRPAKSYSSKERTQFIQMIFQDPYSSLNPRKKAWELISEPLFINSDFSKKECYQKACELMEKVGLRPQLAKRYPHMFSGGQRQRIGIARALILNPKVLICDEPVSALDVSIQAQVLNLLMDLQDELKLSYLFIGHDLSVINHVSNETLVMYLGKVVESGKRDDIFANPKHPYTQALMAATPGPERRKSDFPPIEGELPSPLTPPSGCAFHKRCPIAISTCSEKKPSLQIKDKHSFVCDQVQI